MVMNQNQDNYNFLRKTSSGIPGFETFEDGDDSKFCFQFNGEEGNALFYSQPYNSKRGRDNGIESVKKNMKSKERFRVESFENGFYVLLMAANNQQIARSRLFSTRKEAGKYIKFMHSFQLIEEAPTRTVDLPIKVVTPPSEKTRIKETSKSSVVRVSDENNLPSLKQAFRIEFYRQPDEKPLAGRIEHILSEEKLYFQGLDEAAIMHFIRKFLPAVDEKQEPVQLKKESVPGPTIQVPDIQPTSSFRISVKQVKPELKKESVRIVIPVFPVPAVKDKTSNPAALIDKNPKPLSPVQYQPMPRIKVEKGTLKDK